MCGIPPRPTYMFYNHPHVPGNNHGTAPHSPQNLTTGLFQNVSDFKTWIMSVFGGKNDANARALQMFTELIAMYYPTGTHVEQAPVFNSEGITDWWWVLSRVIGDWVLSCPARRTARLLAGQNKTAYMYHFNHTPTASFNEKVRIRLTYSLVVHVGGLVAH